MINKIILPSSMVSFLMMGVMFVSKESFEEFSVCVFFALMCLCATAICNSIESLKGEEQ